MMKQRTCSHRISELYNEIILTGEFKEEFTYQDSFYNDNFYVTIFRNKDFKSKLLIVNKESQHIVFENILGSSFILFSDFKSDIFLFSIDIVSSSIYKFNNPILSLGEINDSIQVKHNFLINSKSIEEVVIKDDIIYIAAEISSQGRIDFNIDSKIDRIDFSIFKNDYIETLFLLVGISVDNLEILKGQIFSGGCRFNIWNRSLKQRNCILVEYFNDEYQEYQSYLINYKKDLFKPIHPAFLTKVSDNYLVLTPYTESSHYGRYEEFKLIRLSDCNSFNLYSVLPNSYREGMELGCIIFDEVDFLNSDILVIGEYEFSCSNLFNNKYLISSNEDELKFLKHLNQIKGNYFEGYALEVHTIKSTLKEDGSFETLRTDLGELLYRLKYKFDRSTIDEIAIKCSK